MGIKKKPSMSKDEAKEEFEKLLSKKPKDVACRTAEMEIKGEKSEEVVCSLEYPWQKKDTGEATIGIVQPIKIRHLKGFKRVDLD